VLQYPAIWLPAMEEAVKEYALYLRPDLDKSLQEFRIAFRGSFGARQVSARGLLAEFLGGLVRIEGIVTRCSLVRPKLVLSTHYCPATNKFMTRTYSDGVTLDQSNRGIGIAVYPSKDDQGNLLETEFGLCKFRDQQKIVLQVMSSSIDSFQLSSKCN
jgi:DNA replication licensing factor MCM3